MGLKLWLFDKLDIMTWDEFMGFHEQYDKLCKDVVVLCDKIKDIDEELVDFKAGVVDIMKKIDEYCIKQDKFNRLVGERLNIGKKMNDKDKEMYG